MNKQLQRFVMLAVFWVFAMGFVQAQRTITGTVTDEAGEAMIGVNILVIGTNVGTVSDFDGGYTLQVPAGATQIQFSYTGYDRVVVDLGSSSVVDVVMGEGALLEDVVVTGYGTVRRENVTGSIQTVKSDEFNRGSITSAQELIAGKVSGVQVVSSGEPGSGPVIRIRGGSSLSATNDPLIVIDGVPIANERISGSRNNLNIINPNDIESVTVLKDASATAIYGSRASNGVIIITTKKGSLADKFSIDYAGSVSTSIIAKQVDVLSADEYRGLISGLFPDPTHPAHGLLGDADTDWQDVIYDDAISHDHNISLNGHFSDIPYRISAGYSNKDGLLKTDNFNRLTYGINLNPGLLDNKLQLNLSFKGMTDKNVFADGGAVGAAIFFDPTQPIYQANDFGGYFTWLDNSGNPNTLSPTNPLALLEQTDNTSTVNRYILGAQIDYRLPFLEDLRANLNLAYDRAKGDGSKFIPAIASFARSTGGRSENYSQDNKNELLEFFLNYNREINNDFAVDIMGGYSWQHFWFENYFEAFDATESTVITDPDYNTREHFLVSVFGRANVTLFEDFLLTVTVRRDGTSRFAENNRWGTFPGAALAWKIFENNPGTLNGLKFRVGYGLTGQQGIGDENYYPYLARYRSSFTTAQYQFGDAYVATLRPQGYDAKIKWEETSTFNVGFDYGFFDDRINGSIEYYIRKTSDLINFVPIAAGTNLTNFLLTNVGDLENKGIEFSLNTVPWRKGNNEWSLGFNVAFNENEITKLTATDDPNYLGVYAGGISGGVGNNIQIHSVGHPANSFFVYEQVYDAAGVPIEGLYVDRNGDGVVTPDDQYHYEKAAPDAFFGFYTSLDVGRFDLSVGARANMGNFVYDNTLSNLAVKDFIYNSGGGGYLNNTHAQTQAIDFQSPRYFSDYYVRDASFFRVDHITAGYDLGAIGSAIQSLRISATAQNPFVITGYDGIDPEIAVRGLDNVVTTGIDNNIYPRSRTFLFGLNARF